MRACRRVGFVLVFVLVLVGLFHQGAGGSGQEQQGQSECRDIGKDCRELLEAEGSGLCDADGQLAGRCKRSCGLCEPMLAAPPCVDDSEECEEMAMNGDCGDVSEQCKRSCGLCENTEPSGQRKRKASKNQLTSDRHDLVPSSMCKDLHHSCIAWAAIKWCSRDPVFMQATCPESCYMCLTARKSLHQKIRRLHEILSADGSASVQGNDHERFIPGIDPVFTASNALPSDVLIEDLEALQSAGPLKGRSHRLAKSSSVLEAGGDVELVASLPGFSSLCLDLHDSCATWTVNGDCLDNLAQMAVLCKGSCGLCKSGWEDWEAAQLEPQVAQWFTGPRTVAATLPGGGPAEADTLIFEWAQGEDGAEAPDVSAMQSLRNARGKNPDAPAKALPPTPGIDPGPERLEGCRDAKDSCQGMASRRHCALHVTDMIKLCPGSCGLCSRTRDPSPLPLREVPDGLPLPAVGLSTQGMGNRTKQLVLLAIQHGVRRFEGQLGPGAGDQLEREMLGEAIREAGLPRRELYIAMAVDPTSYASVLASAVWGLKDLRTGYLDAAMLTDPPQEAAHVQSSRGQEISPSLYASWQALEKLQRLGILRALATSGRDLTTSMLLKKKSRTPLSFVHLITDPVFPQRRAVDQAWLRGLNPVALNPCGGHWPRENATAGNPVVVLPALKALSSRIRRPIPSICARWALQRGMPVTFSVLDFEDPEAGIPVLQDVFSFFLPDKEMAEVDGMDGMAATVRKALEPPSPPPLAPVPPPSAALPRAKPKPKVVGPQPISRGKKATASHPHS